MSHCVGDKDDEIRYNVCEHNVFTCVTCQTKNNAAGVATTFIRVQSNNMPRVCWRHNTKSDAVPDYKAVDFEVVWNANVNLLENYTEEDFDTD